MQLAVGSKNHTHVAQVRYRGTGKDGSLKARQAIDFAYKGDPEKADLQALKQQAQAFFAARHGEGQDIILGVKILPVCHSPHINR